jgi:uncharacterized RmlC-like cupin family protein
MSLGKGITIETLSATQAGQIHFFTPLASDETMLVQIPAWTIDNMFVHKYQTDRLFVVRGEFALVVLYDGKYDYIRLSADRPQVVTIPPFVPHAAINLTDTPCTLVNAVIRHGEPHPRDYQPVKPPFAYDLDRVRLLGREDPKSTRDETEMPFIYCV